MIVAIDGTLASGKGTIARQVARKYGLAHMDTGRLYRATGVAALRSDTPLTDADALAHLAETLDLDQFDEADLRTAEAGQAASKVAAIPEVRAALVTLQRSFAHREGGAVLDGRDIGTVICPDADIKLWIDANITERARRRAAELAAAGKPISQADMLAELQERDNRDRTRASAPMQMAKDAVLIDTTDLGIDAAVEKAFAAIDAVIANRNCDL